MAQLTLLVPDEALVALKLSRAEAGDELLLAAAVKLYELGRLSSGAAAALAGVPRIVFLEKLAQYGVASFQLTEEELRELSRTTLEQRRIAARAGRGALQDVDLSSAEFLAERRTDEERRERALGA